MTVFDAPQYDARRERRRKILIGAALVLVVFVGALAYQFRNWRYERVVAHFFQALQDKDYERAYGMWLADPDFKQHPEKTKKYPFNEFYRDWGPGGEWGVIRNFHVDGSANPANGSGVVVVVTVNDRKEQARLWVEKKDKTLTFSPY